MKIVIHAGIHRTGTTHLQKTLSQNRKILRANGYLYPFDRPSHQWLVRKILKNPDYAEKLPRQIENQVGRDDHTIIVSGEDFSTLSDLRWLKSLKKRFDVYIVVYLRRQDLWLNSWYNQLIKWPWRDDQETLSPETFLDRIDEYFWLDYKKLLDSWASEISTDKITLVPFEKETVPSIVADFMIRAGIQLNTELSEAQSSSNVSVCAQTLEIIRHFGLNQLKPWARNNVIWHTQQKVREKYGVLPTMVFSPAERRSILRSYGDSNAAVARGYLKRHDGRLFNDESVPDDAPYLKASLPDSATMMRDFVVPILPRFQLGVGWFKEDIGRGSSTQ